MRVFAGAFVCLVITGCTYDEGPKVSTPDWRAMRVVPARIVIDRGRQADGLVVVSVTQPVSSMPVRVERKVRTMQVVVRAYCPCKRCCGVRARGLTKTETNAWRPGLAVSPRVIPYGTKVIVPGYNDEEPVVADDTGPNTIGTEEGRPKIEVRTVFHWQARNWGRQLLTITIVEEVANETHGRLREQQPLLQSTYHELAKNGR